MCRNVLNAKDALFFVTAIFLREHGYIDFNFSGMLYALKSILLYTKHVTDIQKHLPLTDGMQLLR